MRKARSLLGAIGIFSVTLLVGPGSGGAAGPAASEVRAAGGALQSISSSFGPGQRPAGPAVSRDKVERPRFVPGEVIVRYVPGVRAQGVGRAKARAAVASVEALGPPRMELTRAEPSQSVAAAIAALESDPSVLYAEPNWISYIQDHGGLPNDSYFHLQWGLQNFGQNVPFGSATAGTPGADIDALAGWEIVRESPDVVVAVLDTGITPDHPDLVDQLVPGTDFVGEDDTIDRNGHGTHVAGTIGATGNNGIGVAGVSWNARIMPLKVCDMNGACPNTALIPAIVHAQENGVDIANMSLGGPAFSRSRYEAIKAADETLFVVAAGNEDGSNNDQVPVYPCQDDEESVDDEGIPLEDLPNLICVAASDHRDELAGFSNFGAESVDLAAPGSWIASTWPNLGAPLEDDFSGEQPNWNYLGLEEDPESDRWELEEGPEFFADFAITDSRGGNYVPDTEAVVRTTGPGLDLTPWSECRLEYWLRLDSDSQGESLDEVAVLLVDVAESPSEPEDWTVIQAVVGGDGELWHRMVVDLDEFLSGTALQIRFRFAAGADSEPRSGAEIDEVNVLCVGSSVDSLDFAYLSGTSMATPHVAGAAALVRQQVPGMAPAEVKQAILDGVDPIPEFEDMLVTGGRLNLATALELAVEQTGGGEGDGDPSGGEIGDVGDGDEGTEVPLAPSDPDPSGYGEGESDTTDGLHEGGDETAPRAARLSLLGLRPVARGRLAIAIRASMPGVLRAVSLTPVRRGGRRAWIAIAVGAARARGDRRSRLVVRPTVRGRRLIARRGVTPTLTRVVLRPAEAVRPAVFRVPVRLRWR